MAKTVGKQFEADFAASIPGDVYFQRIKDPAQSFGGSGNTSFSPSNPYDYFMYAKPHFFALELKTTLGTLTFWRKEYDTVRKKQTYNIKKNQILALRKAAKYSGVIAGFIFNFRNTDTTYFLSIKDFMDMTSKMMKKSINQTDVSSKGLLIPQEKLRVNFRYDIKHFIQEITK